MSESVEMPSGMFVRTLDLGGDGARVAIKDVVDIAGYPTQAGSRALIGAAPADKHADIVERILASCARIVGKTTLHELAYGVTGLNDFAGTPRNPNFPALIPGGSSSGSAAAVAAGLCDWSVGTDTGGSIRVPAACCGILGLKPTYGRVSRRGFVPEDSSLDCAGPFARDAETLDAAMGVLAPDWRAGHASGDFEIGFVKVGAEPGLWTSAYGAAGRLGACRDLELAGFELAHTAGLTIIASETYAAFGSLLETGHVGGDVAARLAHAADLSHEDIDAAERVRRAFTAEVDGAFKRFDLLALPTLPIYPPRLAEARDLMKFVNITALCRPFNLSGHPAISIPLPFSCDAPASLQLVAPKGEDERLIAAARSYQNLAAPARATA